MPIGLGTPDAPLSAVPHRDGDRIRLVVTGEIDITTADAFEGAMNDVIDQQARSVLVDLAGVRFMDSTGIAALVRAHTRSSATRTSLTVINCQQQVRRVMEVTGVYDLLARQPPA
jgi:anti-sigma B factor antagonist